MNIAKQVKHKENELAMLRKLDSYEMSPNFREALDRMIKERELMLKLLRKQM